MIRLTAENILLFFIYAFMGWCVEVAFAAITTRRLSNRGFLNGPLCPIYGFGMLALVGAVSILPAGQDTPWWAVFLVGMAITTAVELAGGWIMFRIFHTRWWDYSMYRFNLGGYICPQFSLMWGAGSVLMVKGIHPAMVKLTAPLPHTPLLVLDGVLLVYFAVDVCLSAAAAIGLNKRLEEIDELRAALRRGSDKLTEVIGTNAMELDTLADEQRLQLMLASMESRDNAAELRALLEEKADRARELLDRLEALEKERFGAGRLLRAFPNMKSLRHGEAVQELHRHAEQMRRKAREMAEKLKR